MLILIVDDHPMNRKLLRLQLEAEGFTVLDAEDGVEALEVLAREPVDAVISDILMPKMDGYRLCHEVRKTPSLQAMRFILYSSTYTSPDDVRLSVTVGADQFIAKPAAIQTVLSALQVPSAGRTSPTSSLPNDAIVLSEYSSVLVGKLEEKNIDLQRALDESRRAHHRIQQLNAELEQRVQERTAELVAANIQLTTALADVKQLKGLLPICSYCKSIRDDKDYWDSVEGYLVRHTASTFSHGICPACYATHVVPMLQDLGITSPPDVLDVPRPPAPLPAPSHPHPPLS